MDACFPDSVVGIIMDSDLVTPVFLEYYIRTVRSDLEAFAPATARKNINVSILNEVVVPMPPRPEREVLQARLEDVMRKVGAIESAMRAAFGEAERIDRSTLAKAFRGELVPQDPNDEPASALLERIRAERQRRPPRKGRKAKS